MSITTRGDCYIITVPISFCKLDTKKENWKDIKNKLWDNAFPEYDRQVGEILKKITFSDEVKERNRVR